MKTEAAPASTTYFRRAVKNRCPRCGEGPILKNLFNRHDHCPHCHFQFGKGDGFYSGALPINYTLVCLFWIVPLLVMMGMNWISGTTCAVLGLAGALLWPMLLYRYSQCLWIALYYAFVPDDIEPHQKKNAQK